MSHPVNPLQQLIPQRIDAVEKPLAAERWTEHRKLSVFGGPLNAVPIGLEAARHQSYTEVQKGEHFGGPGGTWQQRWFKFDLPAAAESERGRRVLFWNYQGESTVYKARLELNPQPTESDGANVELSVFNPCLVSRTALGELTNEELDGLCRETRPRTQAAHHDDDRDDAALLVPLSLPPLSAVTVDEAAAEPRKHAWDVSARVLDNGIVRAEFSDAGQLRALTVRSTPPRPSTDSVAGTAEPSFACTKPRAGAEPHTCIRPQAPNGSTWWTFWKTGSKH